MAGQLRLARNELNERQRAFVSYYVETGDATKSARLAGYSENTIAHLGRAILGSPAVVACLHAEVSRALVSDAAMARHVIATLAADTTISPKVRLDAAKTLLDRAGHVAPKARDAQNATDLPLNEMTVDELKTLAATLEAEIAGRAKTVSSADAAPIDDAAVDLIG